MEVTVSTPSRICLFGEHQDYLGLEVIASAVNLRFTAKARPAQGEKLQIVIRDESISELGQSNEEGKFERHEVDLSGGIYYHHKRDYFRSVVKVLRRAGYCVPAAQVWMDSTIPIGKGMCSSTTMVLALTAALAQLSRPEEKLDPIQMARLAHQAEVVEFDEPGGMMDHFASALGGLVHLDFAGPAKAQRLNVSLKGCFLLFDSLQQKDTIRVLSQSKYPTLEALEQLRQYGAGTLRELAQHPRREELLLELSEEKRRKVIANLKNYAIERRAYELFQAGQMEDETLGRLLNEHQQNLRDGLGISTPLIDQILRTALAQGAYGGKFNGSGGGGCLFVYAPRDRADSILHSVKEMGYPGMVLSQDAGLTVEVAKA